MIAFVRCRACFVSSTRHHVSGNSRCMQCLLRTYFFFAIADHWRRHFANKGPVQDVRAAEGPRPSNSKQTPGTQLERGVHHCGAQPRLRGRTPVSRVRDNCREFHVHVRTWGRAYWRAHNACAQNGVCCGHEQHATWHANICSQWRHLDTMWIQQQQKPTARPTLLFRLFIQPHGKRLPKGKDGHQWQIFRRQGWFVHGLVDWPVLCTWKSLFDSMNRGESAPTRADHVASSTCCDLVYQTQNKAHLLCAKLQQAHSPSGAHYGPTGPLPFLFCFSWNPTIQSVTRTIDVFGCHFVLQMSVSYSEGYNKP